jgi:hypothetical protein
LGQVGAGIKSQNTLFQFKQVLGSKCALLCDKQWEVPANLLLHLISISTCIHDFTILAKQVLVQSSSSSKARSKRVMTQTMFDVSDPFVVHVLLLTHKFYV